MANAERIERPKKMSINRAFSQPSLARSAGSGPKTNVPIGSISIEKKMESDRRSRNRVEDRKYEQK